MPKTQKLKNYKPKVGDLWVYTYGLPNIVECSICLENIQQVPFSFWYCCLDKQFFKIQDVDFEEFDSKTNKFYREGRCLNDTL